MAYDIAYQRYPMTTHPVEIGSATINKSDPYELTKRIQYLVRHEMPFTEHEEMLATVLEHQKGHDWSGYEKFQEVLKDYHRELEAGSVHAAEMKDKVVAYSDYRRESH